MLVARIHAVRFLTPRGYAAPPDVGSFSMDTHGLRNPAVPQSV